MMTFLAIMARVGAMPMPAPRMKSPLGLISVTSMTATSMSP